MKTQRTNKSHRIRFAATASLGAAFLFGLIAAGCTEESDIAAVSSRSGALRASEDIPNDAVVGRGSYRSTGRFARADGQGDMRGRRGGRQGASGGPLFATALAQDDLTAEQRQTIEGAAAANAPNRTAGRIGPNSEFHAAFVQAVRDGKIDTEAWNTRVEKMDADREARRASRTEALHTLYSTLTPDQRASVAADVKVGIEDRGAFHRRGHRGKHGRGLETGMRGMGRGDNRPVAGCVNGDGPLGEKGFYGMGRNGRPGMGRGMGRGMGMGLFGIVDGLDLTEAQQQQLDALRQNQPRRFADKDARATDWAAAKQCRMDFIESFAGENFDAAARCYNVTDAERAEWRKQRHERFQQLLDILTEEQRNQLADRLEAPRI